MTAFEPYEIIPGDASLGLILVCDHARNTLPDTYGTLGLPASELNRHIAYDIGAEAALRGLAARLGAPAVLATYSRLLIDPNRGEDDPTLIRQLYDHTLIPGNLGIDEAERERRLTRYYHPYHQAIERLIGECEAAGTVPAVIAVHSMTDRWNGRKRLWQVSMLWDRDPRIAQPMLAELHKIEGVLAGDNEPYDGALAGDTMFRHCTAAGLAHVLIEIRQDLVVDRQGVENWVGVLGPLIEKINSDPDIHQRRLYGTRSGAALPAAGQREEGRYRHG